MPHFPTAGESGGVVKAMSDISAIISALSTIRIAAQPEEADIHAAVSAALCKAGIAFEHEYRLMPGKRIDFVCGSIGIEVKKSRPKSAALQAQLHRYLENTALTAIIVVLQRPCALPKTICGKEVHVVSLNRLWGVALH